MSRNSATSLFPQIVQVLYMEQIGPLPFRQLPECVHPFCLASWLLAHQGEGLAEVEASGSTSVCHSFWKADTSNELVPDKVSAFARSLVTSQHLWLVLLWASFLKLRERKQDSKARPRLSEAEGQTNDLPEFGIVPDTLVFMAMHGKVCPQLERFAFFLNIPLCPAPREVLSLVLCLWAWVPDPSHPPLFGRGVLKKPDLTLSGPF